MTYQVLYRTYRPSSFNSVVGQSAIVKALNNAINNNKIAHAYLFCGPRGTGKTSIAKLFAKAINCENYNGESCEICDNCKAAKNNAHPDIIELDAASNNSVEDIRDIIEKAQFAPVLGKYKIYIIDEVHMLSKQAFNALLKTLEEPPKHVIFILATTDPEKIISTVLSRCQRYNFSKISNYDMVRRIEEILKNEKIEYEKDAVLALTKLSDGGMRDALSMLEQCLAYDNKLSYENVKAVYGLATKEEKIDIIIKMHKNDPSIVIDKLEEMDANGIDIKRLCLDIIDIFKEAILYRFQENYDETKFENIDRNDANEINQVIDVDTMLSDIDELVEVINRQKQSQTALFYLELAVLKIAKHKVVDGDAEVTNTLSKENDQTVIHEEKTEKSTSEEKAIVEIEETVKTKANIEETAVLNSYEINDINNEDTNDNPSIPINDANITKEENVKTEEENITVSGKINVNDEILLNILIGANRDEKTSDSIILNRIGLYELEVEKRKFYQALHGAELFASGKDAMIICGDKIQNAKINDRTFNEDLYFFFNDEFGIDKMPFAIDLEERNHLITIYRDAKLHPENYHLDKDMKIEKYKREAVKPKTKEEELYELFGDKLVVED